MRERQIEKEREKAREGDYRITERQRKREEFAPNFRPSTTCWEPVQSSRRTLLRREPRISSTGEPRLSINR